MVRFSGWLIVPRNRHAGLQPWVRADDAASATTASKAPEVFCKAPGGYHKERAPESTEQVGCPRPPGARKSPWMSMLGPIAIS